MKSLVTPDMRARLQHVRDRICQLAVREITNPASEPGKVTELVEIAKQIVELADMIAPAKDVPALAPLPERTTR